MAKKAAKGKTEGETKDEKETWYIVGIMHHHADDYGASLGKVRASSAEEAKRKSEMWVARKKREAGCKPSRDACDVVVFEPTLGMKGAMHLAMAEEIPSE
jgi:hypothetical protein